MTEEEKKWKEESEELFESDRGYWNNIVDKKDLAIHFYLQACRERREEWEKKNFAQIR